jgi:DNA-binding IscR family transcriptional regulator
MEDVNKVFITKEVSDLLDINPSYLIRLAKKLSEEEKNF